MDALLTLLLLSGVAGMAADAYVNILTQPGHILDWWARFLYSLRDRFVGVHPDEVETPEQADRAVTRWYYAEMILKPLLTCEHCVAGEIAFWGSLYLLNGYFICKIIISIIAAFVAVWMAGTMRRIRTGQYHGN